MGEEGYFTYFYILAIQQQTTGKQLKNGNSIPVIPFPKRKLETRESGEIATSEIENQNQNRLDKTKKVHAQKKALSFEYSDEHDKMEPQNQDPNVAMFHMSQTMQAAIV